MIPAAHLPFHQQGQMRRSIPPIWFLSPLRSGPPATQTLRLRTRARLHRAARKGLTFGAAMAVLRELCASPAFTALVLTEVNPTHDPAGELLGRYLDGVTAALAEPARDR